MDLSLASGTLNWIWNKWTDIDIATHDNDIVINKKVNLGR